ncbi:helix-turn-helix transcriptional regulator [Desulfofustis glycolicus]|uniref:Predicted DNA-binding transcriptional regulator YafY, contains an HTH and WYL domains n=1 Tax=Desulfofustis glycolicus DSM 9705 TaxID=1121409 RepID=A0A1M5WQ33_9BACT|nr:WYL domain-containing protein [Desulfofustis glycolicus]MCB2218668.1 WYL domain-containing protein [Desulfobulbaceae bacterium]SHH89609.1 Predicted DNA-binding transcriptional regulator YafY, contains an HTH and WYL domains [Desulfofustis glycolicus DSM 9705]
MSERLKFERFIWFHSQIKRLRFPNSRKLVEEFEISERTAQRDIEFIRDRLQAPLVFDRRKNGYRYTDNSFEFPVHWLDEANLLALVLASRLATTIPDTTIKEDLCRLIGRMLSLSRTEGFACLDKLSDKISVKNIEYARVNEQFFRVVVRALFDERSLWIKYRSPHSGTISERVIQPLHLMHYMGSWYLLAWCSTRQAIRDFALARLQEVGFAENTVQMPDNLLPIKELTRRHFGIMQGGTTTSVILRFSPTVTPRILEQIWHPDQQTHLKPDGSLLLSFPTADFRELTRIVLSYGADVQVVTPSDLQIMVHTEIEKMRKNYIRPDIV